MLIIRWQVFACKSYDIDSSQNILCFLQLLEMRFVMNPTKSFMHKDQQQQPQGESQRTLYIPYIQSLSERLEKTCALLKVTAVLQPLAILKPQNTLKPLERMKKTIPEDKKKTVIYQVTCKIPRCTVVRRRKL